MIVSGEPLLSPGLLLRALVTRQGANLQSERVGDLSNRLGGRPYLFAFGRQALAESLAGMARGRILAPAYVCDTVIDGIKAAGWHWRYYPLGDRLAPHWAWLERNLDSSDSAILLVHYFGFPSDLDGAARFAKRHRLALIEDCAHAFLTAATSPVVGRAGAAAIYSWRKFLPVANGAALIQRGHRSQDFSRAQFGGVAAARELCKWMMFNSGSRMLLRRFGPILSDEPDSNTGTVDTAVPDWIASRVLAAEATNLPRIARKRRDNYRRLFEALSGSWDMKLLTPQITESAVPWCLALTVADAAAREDIVDHLLRSGIGTWPWPRLPADVTGDTFPREFRLASETVCLPVHQDLGDRHLRHMTRALGRWKPG